MRRLKVLPFRRPNTPVPNEEEIVQEYLPFAYAIAKRISEKHPAYDKAILEADAMFGLFRAVRTFDPANGVGFKTYAFFRIRGEMLDGIRRDHIGANRFQQTKEERAAAAIAQEQEHEAALALGAAVPAVVSRRPRRALSIVSLDDAGHLPASTPLGADPILFGRIQAVLSDLPQVEQTVIHQLYFEGQTATYVGQLLDLDPGTVSRIHWGVIEKLRRALLPTDPPRQRAVA